MEKMNLKDRAKQFSVQLPFMEGRDKGELKGLIGSPVTISDYGFLHDQEKDADYVCFITKEDTKRFYFGGQVLTDQMMQLETEGYHEEVQTNGLPVLFGEKVSKNKMKYTTVEFYPELEKGAK